MTEPVIVIPGDPNRSTASSTAFAGSSFVINEWRGSGPALLHVHHRDDEAWHVLEGRLHFRFADGEVDAPAGSTVVVPAGVAHTYEAIGARYLIVLTPTLAALIAELQHTPDRSRHSAIYERYESKLLER